MAPTVWPMYMPSYMPRPMQAEFGELARQHQDLMVCELKIQRMTQTCSLNAVRAAGATTTASVPGSRRSRKKEQAPRKTSSQIASKTSQTPSGAQPSGIKTSTGVTQTAVPLPVSSQDCASNEVNAMVQDLIKSTLTQLGVIPQETPTQF